MTEFYIKINTIENAKKLVDECQKQSFDINATSGGCIVDAKSILGILSLSLIEPIKLSIFETKINAAKFTTWLEAHNFAVR